MDRKLFDPECSAVRLYMPYPPQLPCSFFFGLLAVVGALGTFSAALGVSRRNQQHDRCQPRNDSVHHILSPAAEFPIERSTHSTRRKFDREKT
jgi:hypothetical protein